MFKPGQSGNPKGRSVEKPFADALRMELLAAGEDHKKLREIAKVAIEKAASGDLQAMQFVADRTDGKPKQQIDADVKHSADDTIMGLLERISANGKPIHG